MKMSLLASELMYDIRQKDHGSMQHLNSIQIYLKNHFMTNIWIIIWQILAIYDWNFLHVTDSNIKVRIRMIYNRILSLCCL